MSAVLSDDGPTRRETRLRAAARARMGGLRIVLEGLEDLGNRAAILRSAEALGLLHVHEVVREAGPVHMERVRVIQAMRQRLDPRPCDLHTCSPCALLAIGPSHLSGVLHPCTSAWRRRKVAHGYQAQE